MELLKIAPDVARNYKNYLYRQVKAKHPELNGYDRAIEMEKMATLDVLNKINIDEITQIANKLREERMANSPKPDTLSTNSDSDKQKPTPKTKSTKTKSATKTKKPVQEKKV